MFCFRVIYSVLKFFLIQVDPSRKCVRRHPERAIPEPDENWRSSIAQRTVYVKGFPVETATLDEILKFMQTFGKIDNVYVSHHNQFRSSRIIFVFLSFFAKINLHLETKLLRQNVKMLEI